MNASEYLEKEAKRFGFACSVDPLDGDRTLRPERGPGPSAADLMQLMANLSEAEYTFWFAKDNSVHVHAPHRKEHSWGDRGWDCTHGLTVEGCETFRIHEEFKGKSADELITELQVQIKSRDACVGTLYRDIAQTKIDKINTVLSTMSLTDSQKLRMGLRGRQMAR
jgi:hypothetical protein